ncbi:3-oxoadipate enol-lactonase [Schlegelella sp. S2-27]|uniref:3-oxoadipate enol-lactonase n=1 Tax=Caldimonas mangrovi TaxID=2944811 RepID=A0ABT0YIU6_9BURK|nr:3-oxoadipate enol-lactonase [Caldimonas mangrovi]MCM5678638.1 3-oxoadipate enol-lactonase [Caldimonas mangrovi]
MNDRQDDFDRGVRNRRAVLGDAWVDRSLDNANAFNADFQSLITRYAWHDIWGRPGLDHRTRRLLVLGMTIAQGRWEEYELHLRAAVEGGVSLQEIQETLMQSAIYCGVPAANTAFKLAMSLLKELGMELPAQPLSAQHRASSHHTFSAPQLHVLRQGQGRPVVLSHALGMDVHMWDAVAPALAPDCEVLRYDHRGHGQSAAPAGPYSMDDLVDDAARLVREWGRGPVVWVGLSMGGMVGQGLAARHPELVQALVVANSTAHYPDAGRQMWAQRIATVENQGLGAIADAVMGRYFHEAFRAAHPEAEAAARATLLRTDAAGYVACCHAVSQVDWRDALPRLGCPTLVIAGEQDQGAPVAMSEALAQAVPGARLEVIAQASHISALETPDEFVRLLRGFIDSL